MSLIRFSYTRLDCYGQCGWKYKLKYVDGNYLFTPNAAAAYGTLVHAIEERMALAYQRGEAIDFDALRYDFQHLNVPKRSRFDRSGDVYGVDILVKKYYKEWYDFDTKSGLSYAMKAKDYAASGIYTFPRYMEEHPDLEVVGAELGFEFEYRGYVFNGFIDRLLRVKGTNKFVIHDIKTKDTPYPDRELTSPRQFAIYAAAVREMYTPAAEVECYYELPTLELFQAAGTRGWEKRCWKKINDFLDGIESQDWTPHPSKLCWWCEFRRKTTTPAAYQLCPYYNLYNGDIKNDTWDVQNEWKGMEHHAEVMEHFKQQCAQEEQRSHGLPPQVTKYDIDF